MLLIKNETKTHQRTKKYVARMNFSSFRMYLATMSNDHKAERKVGKCLNNLFLLSSNGAKHCIKCDSFSPFVM